MPTLEEIGEKAMEPQHIPLKPQQFEAITEVANSMAALEKAHGEAKAGLNILMNYIARELGLPKDKRYSLSADRTHFIEVKE